VVAAAVPAAGREPVEVAEQRLRVQRHVWQMPTFRLARFEGRAVHWPTREPVRQLRGWHWLDLLHGVGTVSSGFPLELQLQRRPQVQALAAVPGEAVVVPEAVDAVELEAEGHRQPDQPVRRLPRQPSPFSMDSNLLVRL